MLNKILSALLMIVSASSAQAMYEISRQDKVSCRDTAGDLRIVLNFDTEVDLQIPVSIFLDGEEATSRNTLHLEKGQATFAGATDTDAKFVIKTFRQRRSYKTEGYINGQWQELKCSTSTKFKVK